MIELELIVQHKPERRRVIVGIILLMCVQAALLYAAAIKEFSTNHESAPVTEVVV